MIPTNLNVPMACDSCGGEHVGAAQGVADEWTGPLSLSSGRRKEKPLIDPSSSKNGGW